MLAIVLLVFEGLMIAIFVFKGVYGDDAKPRKGKLLSQLGGKEIPVFYPSELDTYLFDVQKSIFLFLQCSKTFTS